MKLLILFFHKVLLLTGRLFFVKVKIDATPSVVEPGANVGITVETRPNSYVGLMGIDQSVILLKEGNDITEVLLIYLLPT